MSVYEIKGRLAQEAGNLQEMAAVTRGEQFVLEEVRAALHSHRSSENLAAAEALEAIEGLHERLGRASLLLAGAQYYTSAYEQRLV